MRIGEFSRKTGETDITVKINLDGTGRYTLESGVPFFDHMLTMLAKHGLMDLEIACKGDTEVDDHHTIEDLGITLGEALKRALGDKAGICRYATQFLPMDEALVMVSLDISGRPYLSYDVEFFTERTGNFEACLLEEFLRGFAFAAGITLHVKKIDGRNTHHIIEAVMKALARALDQATQVDPRVQGIPSTKGAL